ncbi:MAG: hypothetical protein ABJE66_11270 [Deltaproteobacteria bacterium]
METIAALELVVGFPKLAQVFPAAAGTLRIESDGRAIGFSLEAGTRVEAREAVANSELLHQPTAPFGFTNGHALGRDDDPWRQYTTWLDNGQLTPLSIHVPHSALTIGDDDRVTAITPTAIHVLDRTSRRIRSVSVPKPLDLHDPVKGGVGGELDRRPLYIEPGFVVFVRSPALLVAAWADIARALVFDRVQWAIETHLVAREPELTAPARRGRFDPLTIVTDTGTLRVSVGPEPVRVRDRLWPPCGWATVELANGSTTVAHRAPASHRVEDAPIEDGELFLAEPALFSWSAPSVEAATGFPGPTCEEALAYAHRVELIERRGAYGLLRDAYERLAKLWSPDLTVRSDAIDGWVMSALCHQDTLYEGTVYAVPALVAIAADPETPDRHALVKALVRIAIVALGENGVASPAVIDAFRSMLPVLLSIREASKALLGSWSLIVSAIGFADDEPRWFEAARERFGFRAYAAREDLFTEILEDNY